MLCPNCNKALESEVKFCPECGSRISQVCSCGTQLTGNEKFCPECGNRTTGSSSSRKASSPLKTHIPSATSGYSMGMAQTVEGQPPSIQQIFLNPGDKIGNYSIKGRLGQGGFGSVYRATEGLLEEDHALKVLPLISRDYVKNILLEFKSRDKIKSFDYIIKAWQPQPTVYQGQDILLYPMELADMTFRQWLKEHKKNPETVMTQGIDIFKQACRGVEAIHNAGLTHLDIKPENILLVKDLTKEGQWIAKIADFGLARGVGMEGLAALEDGIGTPAYMAPEQIIAARWKDVGKEADIYALGMILYEMIDGDLPYSGTPKQIKEKKRDASLKISPLKDNSPVAKIAMECLNRDPETRPNSLETIQFQIKIKKDSKETIEKELYVESSNKQEEVRDKKDKKNDSQNLTQNKTNKLLKNQSNIIQPIRHKAGFKIICPYCGSNFYTEDVDEWVVECPHCDESFTIDENYKIIGQKVECPHCEGQFYSEVVDERVDCPHCDEGFTVDEEYKIIGQKVECPHCGSQFYSEVVDEWIDCPHCDEGFTVDKDYKIIGQKVECPHCEMQFYTEDVDEWVDCPYCDEGFTVKY